MLLVVAALAGIVALAAAVAATRRHRAPARRGPAIPLARSPKAGVSHLASQVSELSDLGLHLRSGPHGRRLGALLGSGSAASR